MAASPIHFSSQPSTDSTTSNESPIMISNTSFNEVYELHREQHLGVGYNGRVYRCTHKVTHQSYAVKFLPDSAAGRNEFEQHVRCHRHAGVVAVVACHRVMISLPERHSAHPPPRARLALVLEALPGGELFDVIQNSGALPEPVARHIAQQLAAALVHVHQRGVVHRDVKLENVLLTQRGDVSAAVAKLADFGFAVHGAAPSSPKYTANYVSPEVVAQVLAWQGLTANGDVNNTAGVTAATAAPTPAHDAWAFGVLLFILLCGERPFYSVYEDLPSGEPHPDMMDRILAGRYAFPRHVAVSDAARDLVAKLLVTDPQQRLSVAAALDHAFLRENAAAVY